MKKLSILWLAIPIFFGFQPSFSMEEQPKKSAQKYLKTEEKHSLMNNQANVKSLQTIAALKFINTIDDILNSDDGFEYLKEIYAALPDYVRCLIHKTAKVNLPAELFHNAKTPHEVLKCLVLGCDPNEKDTTGKTVVNALLVKGYADSAKTLFQLMQD